MHDEQHVGHPRDGSAQHACFVLDDRSCHRAVRTRQVSKHHRPASSPERPVAEAERWRDGPLITPPSRGCSLLSRRDSECSLSVSLTVDSLSPKVNHQEGLSWRAARSTKSKVQTHRERRARFAATATPLPPCRSTNTTC